MEELRSHPRISVNHLAYSLHGRWVRRRGMGDEGRIGSVNCHTGRVSVMWPGGALDWYLIGELQSLDRDPEPWYSSDDILEGRTNGRKDDVWWA